ncbi:MAG TPA: pilus assembly protein [Clostridiales bacterium]|nr:MAG: pilus assembly protein [Clostridiales bacterium GWD2_32_59]HAN09414.1 pilus assembly protein [Clostridiales bacterium]
MKIIDANIILRYMLNDIKEQADEAEKIIENEEVILKIEVLAEIVYVLKKVYNINKKEVCERLLEIYEIGKVNTENRELIKGILHNYDKFNLDFIDIVLYTYNEVEGYEIATFDQKLKKLINGNTK